MLPSPLAALLTPRRFFAESEYGDSLAAATLVVSVVAVLLTLSAAAIGQLFVDAIDATVTVDNPDRPPEPFCQEPVLETHEADCEKPETIERDAGAILWDVWVDFLPWVFFGIYLVWLVVGTLLHVGAKLTDGEGSWSDSLAVFGWAMPAELLQAAAAIAFFAWLTAGERITATTEGELQREVETLVASIPDINPLVIVVAVWQIAIVAYGFREAHDIPVETAVVIAAVGIGLASLLAL